MSIFKGLGGLLSPELLKSYQEAIRLALRHEEADIVSQTMACLETEEYTKGQAKDVVEVLLKEANSSKAEKSKPRTATTETVENGQKPITKATKLVGSFLHRKIPSPRPVTPSQKPRDDRKSPFFADPDPQEYVVIKSDFKFDTKRLTEHQRESLSRRREDIPALYNDLSQSCSQDTQKIQEWFDKKQTEVEKAVATNPPREVEDSNKENKEEQKKPVDENLDVDENSESNVLVAKKLDFESRTEFPDDGNAQKSNAVPESSHSTDQMEEKTRKRGTKRKAGAVSDSDSEGNISSRVRRKIVPAGTDAQSDSDSVKSTESEETLKQLSKRTQTEMSRLKINMVFDSKQLSALPGRRRSKINYEEIVEGGGEDAESQETGTLTRHKAAKIAPLEPAKSRIKPPEKDAKNVAAPKVLRKRGRPKNAAQEENPAADTPAVSDEAIASVHSEQKTKSKPKEIPEAKEKTEIQEAPKDVVEDENVAQQSDPQSQLNDSEDIVESSQASSTGSSTLDKKYNNKQCFIRINKMKDVQVKQDDKTGDEVEPGEENTSELSVEDKDKDKLDASEAGEEQTPAITEASVNTSPESRPAQTDASSSPVRLPSSLLNSSSPKNTLKRYIKVKTHPNQGRAAHMLGLVTKQAIAETRSTPAEDDTSPAKRRPKEIEEEGTGRKERVQTLKEPERLGSPSGSRQEKIFNKMKAVPDTDTQTPNLFGNLKNDGEKLSPGNHLDGDGKKDEDASPTQEKEPLPMLEWSSANPPSLTASPSASILKRQRQFQVENDPESPTLASKRKRVSFADPPVSKEMGYEIPASTPPHRMSKVSGSRLFPQRKDTPVRLKQTKIKPVQSPGKSDAEIEKSDTQAIDEDMAGKIIDEDSDSPVIVFQEDETMPAAKVTIDSLATEIEITGGCRESKRNANDEDVMVIREVKSSTGKPKNEETETQQDIFDDYTCGKSPKKKTEELTTQSSMDTLEDTVDIGNLTGLNSTSNLDEIFCERPFRTSTQSTEADTLPVTDSVFSNLPFSQPSQTQNDTMELDQPELLDSTKSFYPSLTESGASIDSVISYLADPMWKPSLHVYFHDKGIETVGDLARLTEREVNRIPVKKSPKIPFVREVLSRFEKSMVNLPSITSAADNSQESVATPNASISSLPPTSTPIAQSSSLREQESPRVIRKDNKSTETQVSVDELLEEIDASVVLKSAIKRCSAENIIASYKMKMKNMAEEDLVRSTIKMLGIESTNNTDAHLKSACRHSGVSKVLGRLPDIFNYDKQFFSKVLTAYKHKLSVSDCISGIDSEDLKNAICQRCTSSDLAEMLSKKLKEEEEAGVTTPMTELSSLQAMLKRMPKDLIISHTVANEELVSPLTVLDIAMQNNNPSDISGALESQPNSVRNRVFGDLCTVEALSTQIDQNMSEDTLTEIFNAISKKLDAPKLLDVFNAVMKKKFAQKIKHEQHSETNT